MRFMDLLRNKDFHKIITSFSKLIVAILAFFFAIKYGGQLIDKFDNLQREALLPVSIEEEIIQYYKEFYNQEDNGFFVVFLFPEEGVANQSDKEIFGIDKVVCIRAVLGVKEARGILFWVSGRSEVKYFVDRYEWESHSCPGEYYSDAPH